MPSVAALKLSEVCPIRILNSSSCLATAAGFFGPPFSLDIKLLPFDELEPPPPVVVVEEEEEEEGGGVA